MATGQGIGHYRLTDHARAEMARRQISEEDVDGVVTAPEQRVPVREGREVLQSRRESGRPSKTNLLRVFVDVDLDPPVVVTVYRTSKVEKYWRTDS